MDLLELPDLQAQVGLDQLDLLERLELVLLVQQEKLELLEKLVLPERPVPLELVLLVQQEKPALLEALVQLEVQGLLVLQDQLDLLAQVQLYLQEAML